METQSRDDLFKKLERLVEEETALLQKVRTCEECVFAVLGHLFQHNDKVHVMMVEDVLTLVHNKETELRTELLHLRLEKARLAVAHKMAGVANLPLEDEPE